MSSIFIYIIIHPIAAFIGWLLCGLVKQDYVRIALRTGILAAAFTPTVASMGTTKVPVSAITAILYGLNAEPRPDTLMFFVWIGVFMIGIVMHLHKKNIPTD